jgi:hypothetical protein
LKPDAPGLIPQLQSLKMKSVIGLSLILLAASPAVAKDFWNSCDKTSVVVKDNTLTATCKSAKGQSICTVLDLTHCIKNDNGYLEQDPDGSG